VKTRPSGEGDEQHGFFDAEIVVNILQKHLKDFLCFKNAIVATLADEKET
jgi:hypothetical protein